MEFKIIIEKEYLDESGSLKEKQKTFHIIDAQNFIEMARRFNANYTSFVYLDQIEAGKEDFAVADRVTAQVSFMYGSGGHIETKFYDTQDAIIILDQERKIAPEVSSGVTVIDYDGIVVKNLPY